MNGYWKNNVEGWDRKGSKRKKQNRNHFLKDNGRTILKTYDSYRGVNKVDENKFKYETTLVSTYEGSRYGSNTPLEKTAGVYKVRVYYPNENFNAKTYSWISADNKVSVKAYKKGVNSYNEQWYEAETHLPIREFLGLTYQQWWKAEIFEVRKLGEIELDWSAEVKRRETVHIDEEGEGSIFIYGKLVPDWKRWTFYNNGRRRKYAAKYANRTTRAKIKAWIDVADWDASPKNHALEKSIAWEL